MPCERKKSCAEGWAETPGWFLGRSTFGRVRLGMGEGCDGRAAWAVSAAKRGEMSVRGPGPGLCDAVWAASSINGWMKRTVNTSAGGSQHCLLSREDKHGDQERGGTSITSPSTFTDPPRSVAVSSSGRCRTPWPCKRPTGGAAGDAESVQGLAHSKTLTAALPK